MENKKRNIIKEKIEEYIYILIEEEEREIKDKIEINLKEIIEEIYFKIIYLSLEKNKFKDIKNIEIYKEVIDFYI